MQSDHFSQKGLKNSQKHSIIISVLQRTVPLCRFSERQNVSQAASYSPAPPHRICRKVSRKVGAPSPGCSFRTAGSAGGASAVRSLKNTVRRNAAVGSAKARSIGSAKRHSVGSAKLARLIQQSAIQSARQNPLDWFGNAVRSARIPQSDSPRQTADLMKRPDPAES